MKLSKKSFTTEKYLFEFIIHLPIWFLKKKHSTDFYISYLNDNILKGFDKDLITNMIYTDFHIDIFLQLNKFKHMPHEEFERLNRLTSDL